MEFFIGWIFYFYVVSFKGSIETKLYSSSYSEIKFISLENLTLKTEKRVENCLKYSVSCWEYSFVNSLSYYHWTCEKEKGL